MKIRFIGALGTVTGSCTLLNHRHRYYLVDCGTFQGTESTHLSENKLPFKASGISGVFLTHAHLDHCGLLPDLVKQGFRGVIYCTRATADLTTLALSDAATLPNSGFSSEDVSRLRFHCFDDQPGFQFGKSFGLDSNFSVSLIRTSHVLGSVGFEFQSSRKKQGEEPIRKTIVFSGDLGCNTEGNCYQPLLNAHQYPSTHADYIVCESTYGGRQRPESFKCFDERMIALKQTVLAASAKGAGSTLIFPCFTMQRLQDLLADLYCLLENHMLPGELPIRPLVMVDSPLSMKYGEVYLRELLRKRDNGKFQYLNPNFVSRMRVGTEELSTLLSVLFGQTHEATLQNFDLNYGPATDHQNGLRIILAGSGMCAGGRVVEHLKRCLPLDSTTVVITGFQSPGTPGAELAKRINNSESDIDGSHWNLNSGSVKASIVDLSGFYSGHADENGLLDFLLNHDSPLPYQSVKRVFLVHGDNQSRQALRCRIEKTLQNASKELRKIEAVDLPTTENRWFDIDKGCWVWDYHPHVESADEAIVSGFGRLQKLEGLITELRQTATNGKLLDQVISQLNMAKLQLAQAQQARVCAFD